MHARPNPLFWSFPVGTWSRVRVQVSYTFPLVLLWLVWQQGFALGGTISLVLVGSVLLHEFAHILSSRSLDGTGDSILLWPLGGLTCVDRHAPAQSQLLTSALGPLVNLLLCGLTLPAVVYADESRAILNPFYSPFQAKDFGQAWLHDLQLVVFHVNWVLFCVNLLPGFPLDGGRILRGILTHRLGTQVGHEGSFQLTYVAGWMVLLLAFFAQHAVLVAIAALMIFTALYELQTLPVAEQVEESFLGYDFSAGYTSLERSERKVQEPPPNLMQRWLERRKAARLRREQEQELRAEEQLDALLAKVHQHGIDALSEQEKRQLLRASDRYRSKGQSGN